MGSVDNARHRHLYGCLAVVVSAVGAARILFACGSFGSAEPPRSAPEAGEAAGGEVDGAGPAPSLDAACASGSTPILVDASDVSDGGDAGKCARVVGGVERSDNCYWVPEREPLTWEFANSRCQKPEPKDHIVTIGSASENAFLVAAFPTCEERWIGLYTEVDLPSAADFRWKNTAAESYRAWAPGFPTGPGKCVVLRPDGAWENRPCIEVHGVLCERE